MTDSEVTYQVTGHTAIITLNRPHVRNAVNAQMAKMIESYCDTADSDDHVWTVVVAAAGNAFCSGIDLNSVASGGFRDVSTERGGFAGFVQRKRTKPYIAAVDGPALAGGCEIALACDLVIASEAATFGIPEVKRSLIAAAGGLMRLPQRLPRGVAMEMALTGDPISASTAAGFGLVSEVVSPGQALNSALGLAERINLNAPLAVRASRTAMLDALDAPDGDGWRICWRAAKSLFDTDDFREGPTAYLEKRAPEWKAR
ncbi:crotonase/enoyl-CoA hydratase family protein [Rhodococcus ruber]|uniref:Crotonase/enoyl-CoA hydratase family protein n=1 Tax=Rhodococcus ruber TaxID=1830 RepID=A0ABT4MIA8_9NOCA|nr:crotonase/enoyl-CoA hydratase family protein [Rhodococcus ruber]MCZ4519466.1 crotonase/enoyl-CoA hydratase family protein [Rhodococcus ruber]